MFCGHKIVGFLIALPFFTACSSLPDIPLTTPEPLTVNINVKMDVYQHEAEGGMKAGEPATVVKEAVATGDETAVTPEQRQAAERGIRDRMEQVQTLKNNRLVGENHEGLLEIREIPPGEYGEYTQKTVAEENVDRETLMKALAVEEKKALPAIKREQGQWRARQSFKGEWVEEQDAEGAWRWVQKSEDPR